MERVFAAEQETPHAQEGQRDQNDADPRCAQPGEKDGPQSRQERRRVEQLPKF